MSTAKQRAEFMRRFNEASDLEDRERRAQKCEARRSNARLLQKLNAEAQQRLEKRCEKGLTFRKQRYSFSGKFGHSVYDGRPTAEFITEDGASTVWIDADGEFVLDREEHYKKGAK